MPKYLDETGLSHLWDKIKAYVAAHSGGGSGVDYVEEQGTSGIWMYRKWHSGVAECWGTYSASIAITSSSASYGGYRSAQITTTAFPTGTFSAAPTVTATSMSSGGNWVTNVEGSTATAIKFFLSCGTSSAASTRNIAFHAMGKWK